MSSDPTLTVQKALYDLLSGMAFQSACGMAVGVYDHVPADAALPYVIVSNIQIDGAAAQGYDASDVHANLTVWSNAPGKVELLTIAGQIRTFLAPRSNIAAPFTLTGHRLITWRHKQTLTMNEPDGISAKATVMIEYLTEPTA